MLEQLEVVSISWETHHTATERHFPYGITVLPATWHR